MKWIMLTGKAAVIEKVFQLVREAKCTVVDSRWLAINSEFNTLTLLISGSWDQLASFEAHFLGFQTRYHINALTHSVSAPEKPLSALSYIAYIIAPDASNVLHDIVQFLLALKLELYEFSSMAYNAPITQTPMLGISLAFLVPLDQSIAHFREHLLVFCDENNFEITIEPQKN